MVPKGGLARPYVLQRLSAIFQKYQQKWHFLFVLIVLFVLLVLFRVTRM